VAHVRRIQDDVGVGQRRGERCRVFDVDPYDPLGCALYVEDCAIVLAMRVVVRVEVIKPTNRVKHEGQRVGWHRGERAAHHDPVARRADRDRAAQGIVELGDHEMHFIGHDRPSAVTA
jgi:hypothetical protein